MSHANLNKKDMQKRYQNETEQVDDAHGLVDERRGCFTENYLVFSVQDKLP
jgi:hypothetical protein